MSAKAVILFAVFAAVSCNGAFNTGVSSGSRVQDGHGNYAFEYGIASNGAKRSRSEVGSGAVGPLKTSYAVSDSHIAPHGGYARYAAAPLGLGLGHAGVVGLGGYGLGGYGLGGYGGYGVGHGYGLGGLGVGYGAPALGLAGVGKYI